MRFGKSAIWAWVLALSSVLAMPPTNSLGGVYQVARKSGTSSRSGASSRSTSRSYSGSRSPSRGYYRGPRQPSGSYSGGSGSSHKGGTYKNTYTGNRYQKRK